MNKLLFILILFPLHLFAEEKNLYAENELLFQTGRQPEISTFQSGWYTGRCYTRREPLLEKAGAFVLITVTSEGGSAGIKQIVPASSIRDESDYFDEIDAEEFENYNQELYEKNNQPGKYLNGSFTSDLYYGILIGTLHPPNWK